MTHFNFVISRNAKWGHAGTGKYSFTKKHCTALIVPISQLVRCSFPTKLHPKQKWFDDSCISFCVGK